MFTTHGHWFAPGVAGESPDNRPDPSCYGPLACLSCAQEVAQATGTPDSITHVQKLAADPVYRHHAETMAEQQGLARLGVLATPAPPVPAVASSTGVLEVPVDELTDWYQRYLEAKDAEAKIKEVVNEARATFLDALNRRYAELPDKVNMTIGGRPVLQRQVVVQNRVDTTRLRNEQPALAKQYSKEVRQERLNIL